MGFYHKSKKQRTAIVQTICEDIEKDILKGKTEKVISYFSDEDTYIRKAAYQAIGKMYLRESGELPKIIKMLMEISEDDDFRVRQTVVNAAGEIGRTDFESVMVFFDKGLFDNHHSPRNAVIGSLKKMGEKNPLPVLKWARLYLHHQDKEIRREICHGIELRGRTHPEDILPLLKELQDDPASRVRNTLVHVIGQISYKQGCLSTVTSHLKSWKNKTLITEALKEIIDVHRRYKNFAIFTVLQVQDHINKNFQK